MYPGTVIISAMLFAATVRVSSAFLNIKASKFKEIKSAIYFTKPIEQKRYIRSCISWQKQHTFHHKKLRQFDFIGDNYLII